MVSSILTLTGKSVTSDYWEMKTCEVSIAMIWKTASRNNKTVVWENYTY